MKIQFVAGSLLVGSVGLLVSGCATHRSPGGEGYLVQRGGVAVTEAARARSTTTVFQPEPRYQGNPEHINPVAIPAEVVKIEPRISPFPDPVIGKPIGRIDAGILLDDTSLPPNAVPGECYARVYEPAQYEAVIERVIVQEASRRIEVKPAKFEWVEERVLIQEKSTRLEVVPAEYDWVEEKVMITPASKRMEEVAAVYEWVEEKVLVKPAHTVWKRGNGLVEKVDNATGEIMCLVEVPAQYETVRRQVLKTAAKFNTVDVPAEYKTIRKKVMLRPPETKKVSIPAEYDSVKVQKLVKAEQREEVPIEARYEEVEKQVMVSEGRNIWRRVLCETNMTPDMIMQVQEALKNSGYEPGPIDGKFGDKTRIAIESYQREASLSVGGLTYQTLESLGISL